jgi:hypothetical protein
MPEANATGTAGTVFLCHPFLVHAAQPHRGVTPRFLAQPPLYPRLPFELTRSDGDYSLIEKAIRLGLTDWGVHEPHPRNLCFDVSQSASRVSEEHH